MYEANRRVVAVLRRSSQGASCAVMCAGGLALAGWLFGVEALRSIVPGWTSMKANTAVGLILAGLSLWLLRQDPPNPARRRAGRLCAGVVALIGAITLAEYLFGWRPGIDELLFKDTSRNVGADGPGRMALFTTIYFIALGGALWQLPGCTRRGLRLIQLLATLIALAGLINVLGYLYGVTTLSGPVAHTQIACNTALSIVVLAIGILAARPEAGIMAVFSSEGVVGAVLRRLLPAGTAIILAIGIGQVAGLHAGYFDAAFATALGAALTIVLFAGLAWWTASSFHRTDSEHRRVEATLRESEERFATAFMLNPAAVAITRLADGWIVDVNDTYARLVGYPRQELIGRSTIARNLWADPADRDVLIGLVRVQGAVREHEVQVVTGSGERRDVLCSMQPITTGGQACLLTMLTDISARKRSERALAVSNAGRETLLRATSEDDLLQRVCEVVVAVGHYRLAWVGYPEQGPEQLIRPVASAGPARDYLAAITVSWGDNPLGRGPSGRAIRERTVQVTRHMATDPSYAPWRARALGHGFGSSVVYPLFAMDQLLGQVAIYAPEPDAFDEEEVALLGHLMDDLGYGIGAQRATAQVQQLNAELEQRVQERTLSLEAANKELEAFSYSVSHDLRAPLRAITGFAKLLLDDHAAALDDDAQYLTTRIYKNTQHMGELVDDLLAFSRLGRQTLGRQLVSMESLVQQTIADLDGTWKGRCVEFEVGDLPPAYADPGLLRQVWTNLLANAVKFTQPRAVAHIEVGCSMADGACVYFVRDNGVGFDMQYAGKLFGVFQRLHRAEDFEGTGVGLALVQRVVHRHGGRVWAEAAVDQGATFSFCLGESDG